MGRPPRYRGSCTYPWGYFEQEVPDAGHRCSPRLLIGLSLGALGGGGSILTVPALVFLLHQSPHAATTGSLLIVGITALAGMAAHQRAGRVRLAQGVTFGILGVAGSYAGARLSASIGPACCSTCSPGSWWWPPPSCSAAGASRRRPAGRRGPGGRPGAAVRREPARRPRGATRPCRRPAARRRQANPPLPARAAGPGRSRWTGRCPRPSPRP